MKSRENCHELAKLPVTVVAPSSCTVNVAPVCREIRERVGESVDMESVLTEEVARLQRQLADTESRKVSLEMRLVGAIARLNETIAKIEGAEDGSVFYSSRLAVSKALVIAELSELENKLLGK